MGSCHQYRCFRQGQTTLCAAPVQGPVPPAGACTASRRTFVSATNLHLHLPPPVCLIFKHRWRRAAIRYYAVLWRTSANHLGPFTEHSVTPAQSVLLTGYHAPMKACTCACGAVVLVHAKLRP